MPQILRETVFGGAGANPNVFAGSAFEYIRQNAVLSMGIAQSAAGSFATVNVGSDVVCEEHLPFVLTTYPIIPDHFYYQDVAAAMDRLVISVRATGAVTYRSVALITGI